MIRHGKLREFARLVTVEGMRGTDAIEKVMGPKYFASRRRARERAQELKHHPSFQKFRAEFLKVAPGSVPSAKMEREASRFLAEHAVGHEPERTLPAPADGLRWDMVGDRLAPFRSEPRRPFDLRIKPLAASYIDRGRLEEIRGSRKRSAWQYHP